MPAKKEELEVYRASDLSDDLERDVLMEIERGSGISAAGVLAGLKRDTIREYMKRGRKDQAEGVDSQAARFVEKVDISWERRRQHLVAQIAGAKDWRAKAWVLERDYRMVEPKWEDSDYQAAMEELHKANLELKNKLLEKDLGSSAMEQAAGRIRDLLRSRHMGLEDQDAPN